MQCPASVKEGGLVAHAAFDCPVDGLPLGKQYCEYRDGYVAFGGRWSNTARPGERRIKAVRVTISATTGGAYPVWNGSLDSALANSHGSVHTSFTVNVPAGKTVSTEYQVWGVGNYSRSGNSEGHIYVGLPGNFDTADAIGHCSITVVDDDNTAYVGSRYYHPYNGTWLSRPHCYDEVGCAFGP